MNDENLPQPQAAFERLSDQAAGLDTMTARRFIEHRSRRRRQNLGALAAACVAILAAVGAVVWQFDDPDQDVATDPSTSTSTTSTAAPSSTSTSVPTTTVPIPPATETLSIAEFLEQQEVGDAAVDVSGHLVNRGGSWVLCESARFAEAVGHFCDAPWVMVTNYDRVVNAEVGPVDGPSEAALALAKVDPDFAVDDGIVWTPDPVTLTLIAVDADPLRRTRAAVPSWPTDADLTSEDLDLVAAFEAIDGSDPLDAGPLRLAESGVRLGLSNELLVTRTPKELENPDAWVWTLERDMFRGRTGAFSALELLTGQLDTTILAGPHGHCPSPPMPIHPDLQGLRQISIQPIGIDSCLQWHTSTSISTMWAMWLASPWTSGSPERVPSDLGHRLHVHDAVGIGQIG